MNGARETGHLADRAALRVEGRRRGEVTGPRHGRAQRTEHDRQLIERPGLLGEPDLPGEHRAPGVVIPQRAGGRLREPAPAEFFRPGHAGVVEGAQRAAQCRCRGGQPVGDHHGQAGQHQVRGVRGVGGGWDGPDGTGDFEQVAGACQPPGEQGRHPRGEVGLAGQAGR